MRNSEIWRIMYLPLWTLRSKLEASLYKAASVPETTKFTLTVLTEGTSLVERPTVKVTDETSGLSSASTGENQYPSSLKIGQQH